MSECQYCGPIGELSHPHDGWCIKTLRERIEALEKVAKPEDWTCKKCKARVAKEDIYTHVCPPDPKPVVQKPDPLNRECQSCGQVPRGTALDHAVLLHRGCFDDLWAARNKVIAMKPDPPTREALEKVIRENFTYTGKECQEIADAILEAFPGFKLRRELSRDEWAKILWDACGSETHGMPLPERTRGITVCHDQANAVLFKLAELSEPVKLDKRELACRIACGKFNLNRIDVTDRDANQCAYEATCAMAYFNEQAGAEEAKPDPYRCCNCGDEGFINVPCPQCGKQASRPAVADDPDSGQSVTVPTPAVAPHSVVCGCMECERKSQEFRKNIERAGQSVKVEYKDEWPIERRAKKLSFTYGNWVGITAGWDYLSETQKKTWMFISHEIDSEILAAKRDVLQRVDFHWCHKSTGGFDEWLRSELAALDAGAEDEKAETKK